MKGNASTVKNPLTVIAIFAGTAEISGTAILPLLEAQSQQTYIWFLMLFPLILIIFFFVTLNVNHKVLYAPSDFSNEDNFVNILKKPSIQETISNIEDDLQESNNEKEEIPEELNKNNSSESTKEKREEDVWVVRNINAQRMREAQMAELLVLNKLEKEFNSPIQREMMIKTGRTKVIFDGVIQTESHLTGIEVKYMRKRNTFNLSMWSNLTNRFELLYHSLTESQKESFSIIFAVVTDENPEDLKPIIESKFDKLSFPVKVRIYDFDNLRNEQAHNN